MTHPCRFSFLSPLTYKYEYPCKKLIDPEIEFCCVHDPESLTGCRYRFRKVKRNHEIEMGGRKIHKPYWYTEEFCPKCGHVIESAMVPGQLELRKEDRYP